MKIKTLYIDAFGKFRNRKIELRDGINLIYGGNEAGKTTLHRFIEGMFFGFYKPYSKNKQYTSEYEKYYPWDQAVYQGAIEYEHEGANYRLERNFEKNKEEVRLYRLDTGEELTQSITFDPVTKLPDAAEHFEINSVLFRNTISIAQMSNATEDALAQEIGELLVNTGGTHGSNISFKQALDTLQKQKNEIGTRKQSKSPLGMQVVKLENLLQERENATYVYEENKERYRMLTEHASELETLRVKKAKWEESKEIIKILQAQSKLHKHDELNEQIRMLSDQIEHSPSVTEDEYDRYQQEKTKKEVSEKRLQENREKQQQTEAQMVWLEREFSEGKTQDKNNDEEMMRDAALLSQRVKQLQELKEKQDEQEDDSIVDEYYKSTLTEKILSKVGTVLIMLAVTCAALGFFWMQAFYYAAIGSGLLGLVLIAFWAYISNRRSKLEKEYVRYDTDISRTTNMIIMYEIDISQMRSKYGCKDIEELQGVLEHAQTSSSKKFNYEKQEEGLKKILENLKKEEAETLRSIETYEHQMQHVMSKAGAADEQHLKQLVENTREKAVLQEKLAQAKESRAELLETTPLDELQALASKAEFVDEREKNELKNLTDEEVDDLNQQMLDVSNEIASIRGSISESENTIRSLNVIDEEINLVENKIEYYESDLRAIDLAIHQISTISSHFHGDFAEEFNRYVSDAISSITHKKYNDVKVNDKMQIKVMDTQINRLTDLKYLSAGTIDQLYFSVRFAIMDLILENKSLPIFLDDCFLQYDDLRLSNILTLLAEKAKQRQVILMSCRAVEKDSMLAQGIAFHQVNL